MRTIEAWDALRRVALPSKVIGGITEAAWISAHLLLYPWGTRPGTAVQEHLRVDDYGPIARGRLIGDVISASAPVLLVHGLADNRSVFTVLTRTLARHGFRNVQTTNYSVFTRDVRTAAREFGQVVERMCGRTGHDRIHVIGHSLGGLIARYYVQRLGGDTRVATLVTLGTPHGGTAWSRLAPRWLAHWSILMHLHPDSPLVRELEAAAPGCRTSILAIYSDLDQVVLPVQAGRCEHPDLDAVNVLVHGVGHMSLPIDPRVARLVAEHLWRPERPAQATDGPGPRLDPAV